MDQSLCHSASSTDVSAQTSDLRLDALERLTVTVLYGWLVVRVFIDSGAGIGLTNALPLLSEGLVVAFVLARRPTSRISKRPGEWTLALASTCAPLLVIPAVVQPATFPLLVSAVWLVGMLVQLHAKIVLGRSFGLVPAHRGLKMSGPYRVVRHPMYAGYLLTHLAFLALSPSLWNLVVYIACYSLQIPRLLAEERLLSRDASYLQYASIVRYRLLPGVF